MLRGGTSYYSLYGEPAQLLSKYAYTVLDNPGREQSMAISIESARIGTNWYSWIHRHYRHVILLPILFLATPFAHAQQGKTILVLDASGSMWQQIDEGYKIKVAQDVINELLVSLPAEQQLGLITYGHRRKGDCGDIEMLVPPGPATRTAIASAVESLNPTGKTPLSAAVIQAADELRIEENAATVILVSDGRETCDLDPCAVGNELNERGIDFTTHVIGFDVSEENDRAQLRCLAENTGGKFLTASTASELTRALVEVSKPEASQPIEKLMFTADAVDENNQLITNGLTWSLTANDTTDDNNANTTTELLSADQQATLYLQLEINPGQYTLSATRTEDGAAKALDVNFQRGEQNHFRITFPAITYSATINGPDSVIIGEPFEVEWEGPSLPGDYIAIAMPNSVVRENLDSKFVGDVSSATLRAPAKTGPHELRYVQANPLQILAIDSIMVKDAPATLLAENTSPAATSTTIEWTGPDQDYDFIAVARPGQSDVINSQRTSAGSPLQLQMPAEVGEYELRYMLYAHNSVLATRPITVVEAGTTMVAPERATIGARVPVTWNGPDEAYDSIIIAAVGDANAINQTRTNEGSPLEVEMPSMPGHYELRYRSYKFNADLATRPIKVESATVKINAQPEAKVGESVSVHWEGPDEPYDTVAISKAGDTTTINQTRTSDGNPLTIQMPTEAGDYELRYVLYQDQKVLVTRPITVTDAIVTLNATDQTDTGKSISVEWEGPNEAYDAIAIARVGEKKAINQTRTSRGNPLQLQMPAAPGEYEIRYVLYQDSTVLATRAITVNAARVVINAPEEAGIGSTITVNWEGPNADYDVIAVANVGENKIINQTRTSKGNPLDVLMPATPGNYELRYVLYQDSTILATRPLLVKQVEVSLRVPQKAKTSEVLKIQWSGPDAAYDEIVLARPGTPKPITSVRTNRGSPAELRMPAEPGDFEIHYILYQDRTVLKTMPVVVTD